MTAEMKKRIQEKAESIKATKEKWPPKYPLWQALEIYAQGIKIDDSDDFKREYTEAMHTMRFEITRAMAERPEETKELAKLMTPWRAE